MNELEWHLHSQWAEVLMQECKKPKGFIYLDVSPQECFTRVTQRNRNSEAEVSLSYLYDIDAHHRSFLIDRTTRNNELNKVPVLHIKTDASFSTDLRAQEQILSQVQSFIKMHQE